MSKKRYKLRYLPLFYEDLEQAVLYIAHNLNNPEAARKLLNTVESAILKRLDSAESFEPYHSLKERQYPYYRIYVNSYIIYYVIIDDEGPDKIMEIRRFLYHKRNHRQLL